MVSGNNKYFGGGLHRERVVSKNANVLSMGLKIVSESLTINIRVPNRCMGSDSISAL
jgi:hypothetical protein